MIGLKRGRLRRAVIEEEARRLDMNSFASRAAHRVVRVKVFVRPLWFFSQ